MSISNSLPSHVYAPSSVKNRRLIVFVVALVILLTVALFMNHSDPVRAMAPTRNALISFLDRSPGERGWTKPIKKKSDVETNVALDEQEFVKTFAVPPEEAVDRLVRVSHDSDIPIDGWSFAPGAPPDTLTGLAVIGGPGTIGGGNPTPPGIDGGISGSTPGSDGSADGDAQIVSPVPEPSTWAMLIMGFLIIGMAMRRGASNARSAFVQCA